MKRSRFSEEQIISILKGRQAGLSPDDVQQTPRSIRRHTLMALVETRM